MRIGEELYKGYTLNSFQDAFNRYISSDSSVTPLQRNDFNNLDENQNVTQDNDVTDEKRGNQLNLFNCNGVTDEIEDIQREEGIGLDKTGRWEAGTI